MIYVHVGLHKTGSTAIQTSLRHLDNPRSENIFYAHDGGLRDPERNLRQPTKGEQSYPRYRRLLTSLEHSKISIISSEGFLGGMRDLYEDAPKRARQLVNILGPQSQLTFVIYLRPQSQWVQSTFIQMVQEGESPDSSEWLNQFYSKKFSKWSNLIRDLSGEIGSENLVVRPYVSNIEKDFAEALNIPQGEIRKSESSNESISPIQAELMSHINARFSSDADARNRRAIRYFFQHIAPKDSDKNQSTFSTREQKKLILHTKRDWEELQKITSSNAFADTGDFQEAISKLNLAKPQKSIRASSEEIYFRKISSQTLAVLFEQALYRKESRSNSWGAPWRKTPWQIVVTAFLLLIGNPKGFLRRLKVALFG